MAYTREDHRHLRPISYQPFEISSWCKLLHAVCLFICTLYFLIGCIFCNHVDVYTVDFVGSVFSSVICKSGELVEM